jgi:hypothetical protein
MPLLTICHDKPTPTYNSLSSASFEERAFANSRVRVCFDNPASKSIRRTSIDRTTTVGKSATTADSRLRECNLVNPLLRRHAP